MTGAPTLEAGDQAEARAALRNLVDASGMSRRALDELAGLPLGYTDKLLCEPPMRNLGPTSFFALLAACAHRIRFVPDPVARARLRRHHKFIPVVENQRRQGGEHWRHAKALSIVAKMAKETGKIGAIARLVKMTPAQRKRVARIAAKARWAKPRVARGAGTSPAAAPPAQAPRRRPRSAGTGGPKAPARAPYPAMPG
jgi:hypothetical protein